jgi:hypothetical protein
MPHRTARRRATRRNSPRFAALAFALSAPISCSGEVRLDAPTGAADATSTDAAATTTGTGMDASSYGGAGRGGAGTGGCQADEKECGSTCVKLDDPLFGCGAPSCDPCGLAHATPACSEGACALEWA